MKDLIKQEILEAQQVLESFLSDDNNIDRIEEAADILVESFKNDNKVLACGNGGSSCDAMHFCEELTGRFREDRNPLAAIALSADSAFLTCTSNDFGYNYVFSRHLMALGRKGDVLLAISTSGDSENVLLAANYAKQNGIKVIGLTGKNGGKLAEVCDVEIRVPHHGYSDRIQEIHIKVIHILILLIEQKLGLDE
jgi:D-sedoheptulose 7-phosphate isomerase